MNRRELLKQSIGLGAAVASGCAAPHTLGAGAPGPDMEAYLAQLDADLACLDRADLRPALRAHLGPIANDPRFRQAFDAHSPLAIKAAKALYLTASFRDLPEASRLHPGMQQRMLQAAPLMTEAVFGMREHLANLTGAQKKLLQEKLRTEPTLGEALCRSLDDQITMARIQPERRIRQRMVLNSYAWRMEHQSVSAVVDPQLDKVDRFLQQQSGKDIVLFPGPEAAPPGPLTGTDIGLRLMGIGAVTAGVGLLMLFIPSPVNTLGAIGTTIGGALLVIGLLVLVISSLAHAGDEPKAPAKGPAPLPPTPEPGPGAPPPI